MPMTLHPNERINTKQLFNIFQKFYQRKYVHRNQEILATYEHWHPLSKMIPQYPTTWQRLFSILYLPNKQNLHYERMPKLIIKTSNHTHDSLNLAPSPSLSPLSVWRGRTAWTGEWRGLWCPCRPPWVAAVAPCTSPYPVCLLHNSST